MIRFEKNTMNAELVKGDTGNFSINPREKDTKKSLLENGHKVYFCIKKDVAEDPFFERIISVFKDGVATIEIPAEETKNFEPGTYVYRLYIDRNGVIDTLTPTPVSYFVVKEG